MLNNVMRSMPRLHNCQHVDHKCKQITTTINIIQSIVSSSWILICKDTTIMISMLNKILTHSNVKKYYLNHSNVNIMQYIAAH